MDKNQSQEKNRVKTEKLVLYDSQSDGFVVRKVRKMKISVLPTDLDYSDKVRTPILQILRDMEHEHDPRLGTYCLTGDREGCTLYDQLVKVSNEFLEEVPRKHEQERYINAPERIFLNCIPSFCEACIWAEHKSRRRENALVRRFIGWLWPSR